MPKKPNILSSRLRWSALGLMALSVGMFYLSAKKPKSPALLLGIEAPTAKKETSQTEESASLEAPSSFPERNPGQEPARAPDSAPTKPSNSVTSFEASESTQSVDQVSKTENETVTPTKGGAEVPVNVPEPTNELSMVGSRKSGSAPPLSNLLSGGGTSSSDHTSSNNKVESVRLNAIESLDSVSLQKTEAPDPVAFDKPRNTSQPNPTFSKSKTSESSPDSARDRLLASNPSPSSSSTATKNKSAPTQQSNDTSDAEDPPMPFSGQQGESGGGTQLTLAKPYCFLLPKSSPALQCAMESVKLIVDEYAKADVHVVPLFRWWGDDYSNDPNTLEQQAQQACNLQKAFPWMKGGNQTGSIQVFTRDPIPTLQCKQKYPEDPVSGCSNLCPSGSPSFSTVSEAQCSAGTALHESGHSNCCAAQCKNQGDCKPFPGIDAGCGLCLEGGGQSAFSTYLKRMYASQGPKECKLTAAALESIRAGASPNPGYLYNPSTNYKPRGKKLDSIFGKKGVKKLYRGLGDPADGDGEGEGSPMAQDDGSAISRRTSSSSKTKGAQNRGEDPVDVQEDPRGYTEQEIKRLIQPAN